MYQAPWIPRGIYSLKISLLSDQFKITSRDKAALLESIKAYEKIDKSIAKAALQMISQHLCLHQNQSTFDRLKIDDSFLHESPNMQSSNASFQEARKKVSTLRAVDNTVERAVKLTQDFHGLITVYEEQKQFLLRCEQENRNI
ncbi:hypothetical protein J437_LFUL003317 [Ladona fulva]|uniref:Uncharacterized protein n=1 Tax=Ladona fulva TaxID=123851 RepID=A0A8K0PBK2_LADFU|nr:hypothetical protein J437_LFUL003317 [Ladona fulva]